MWRLYALTEPDGEIRYIGYTGKEAETRLDEHLKRATKDRKTRCDKWINHLVDQGHVPAVIVLHVYDKRADAIHAEIELIAHLPNLVNGTRGGTGGATSFGPHSVERQVKRQAKLDARRASQGYVSKHQTETSTEEREWRSEALKQRWQEDRETLLSYTRKGIAASIESRRGKKVSLAQAEQNRVNARQPRSEQAKANLKAAWTPERRASHAAKVRAAWERKRSVQLEEPVVSLEPDNNIINEGI